jgi:hypothetical protein
VVLSLDGARIWLRDEKIRRKLAAELKVGHIVLNTVDFSEAVFQQQV